MNTKKLKIEREPRLSKPRLVMGLSGWMDGGDVSTGTIKFLREKLGAEQFAHIEPEGFYLYSFPAPMELSAILRPHTRMKEGLVQTFEIPTNIFYCSEKQDIVLFSGKEPNLAWEEYADCIFGLCDRLNIREIYFVGSVAGLTPHTREPRMTCSVSDEKLKALVPQPGLRFSNYEGPASIITYMTFRAQREGVNLLNMVAEIPAYVQGYNPRCIEAATRFISRLLDLQVNLDDLREMGDEFEKKLTDIVNSQTELAKKVGELEEDYDNQVFDTQMGDLKEWLQEKGVRLD
ncbi:MAG: PAC2 family protein [Sedimentisphaerales bacterium]|nr:PAC2 family protein [Sedimentisphaerales bacterium]